MFRCRITETERWSVITADMKNQGHPLSAGAVPDISENFGAGTQQIEDIVKAQFPQARVLRMDMDTTRQKDGHEKILSAFANGEADVLVGTQI